MDLIEHDEAVLLVIEEERRIGELGPVFAGLKIEVDGRGYRRDGVGQRRFSDLTWANQGNGGLPGQGVLNGRECTAGNHLLADYPRYG
jgi:hypothetical protein